MLCWCQIEKNYNNKKNNNNNEIFWSNFLTYNVEKEEVGLTS